MSNPFSVFSALSTATQKLDKATLYAFLPLSFITFILTVIYYLSKGSLHPIAFVFIGLVRSTFLFLVTFSKKYFAIQRAKNQPISIELATKPFTANIIISSILAMFIKGVILTPIALLFLFHGRIYTLILSIALLAYILIRFSLADYFIIEKNMTAFDAIEASFAATRWQFWKILGAITLTIAMIFGIALTVGIGGIWLIPLIQIFWGEIYLQLSQPTSTLQSYKPAKGLESEMHLDN